MRIATADRLTPTTNLAQAYVHPCGTIHRITRKKNKSVRISSETGAENEAVEQLVFADRVLLNKTDLVDEATLAEVSSN